MNAIRRSFRLTAVDPWNWEVSVVDVEFFPDGRQQRSLPFIHLVATRDIARIAGELLDEHINRELERVRKGYVEAGERE